MLVVSDSETAFLRFENLFLITYLFMFFFFVLVFLTLYNLLSVYVV